MTQGVVIGKFYPLHAGHQYLIETAEQGCDKLTILLVDAVGEEPSAQVRKQWIEELYPHDTVLLVPDIYKDHDSKAWAEYTVHILGKPPDVVFTSEEYGERWAYFLGCKHVSVDKDRTRFPVSGTVIRNQPLDHWEFLPAPVRAYYAKRVCVLGAESTGTTTLAQALARHYQTVWVPEYGRLYSEAKMVGQEDSKWYSEEFVFIAQQQNALEDMLARQANRLLICDTDSFTTCLWHERYMGFWSEPLEEPASGRRMDLYLLTAPDIPFIQDGFRDGEHIRSQMHCRFIQELERWGKPYLLIEGTDFDQRLKRAIQACDEMMRDSGASH